MMPLFRLSPRTVVALAVILFCLIAITVFTWPIHGLVLQLFALLAMIAALRAFPPFAQWFTGMPGIHRALFLVLVTAVVAGHFIAFLAAFPRLRLHPTRTFFPFVAWDIFSAVSEQRTVTCRELIGTTADGKPVRLLVEQLLPSIVQFDLPPQDEPEKIEHLVTALAREYNRHHVANRLQRVDLMLVSVDLFPPPRPARADPSCQLLHRYELFSDPSS